MTKVRYVFTDVDGREFNYYRDYTGRMFIASSPWTFWPLDRGRTLQHFYWDKDKATFSPAQRETLEEMLEDAEPIYGDPSKAL